MMSDKEIIDLVKNSKISGCALEKLHNGIPAKGLVYSAADRFGFSEAFAWGILSGWDSMEDAGLKQMSYAEAIKYDYWSDSPVITAARIRASNGDYEHGRSVGQRCWKAIYMNMEDD